MTMSALGSCFAESRAILVALPTALNSIPYLALKDQEQSQHFIV